jgi:hypothetical protein
MNYQFAFNNQSGNHLDLNLGFYNRVYDESSELDVNAIDLELGPRFHFGPTLNPSASIRPYVAGSTLRLDNEKYVTSAGIGLNVRKLFSPSLLTDLYLYHEEQDYFDTPTRVGSRLRSGPQDTITGRLTHLVNPLASITMDLSVGERDAEADYEDRDLAAGTIAYVRQFRSDSSQRRPWSISISATKEELEYAAPDPFVDPDVMRHDERWTGGVTFGIPVGVKWNVLISALHTDNASSLPNYKYRNTGGAIGMRGFF